MTKYYSLLVRDDKDSPWGVHFGDYDRECVEDEQRDIVDSDEYAKGNTRIVCTGDTQAEINARVMALNGEVA